MTKPIKTKLCWNCEGSVSRTAENCQYCGVYLSPEGNIHEEESPHTNSKFTAPLYTPDLSQETTLDVPTPPYQVEENGPLPGEVTIEEEHSGKQVLMTMLLLSAGLLCFLFGFLLIFFSQDGTLTLEWKEEHGVYFTILSLPLLYLGWRALGRMK